MHRVEAQAHVEARPMRLQQLAEALDLAGGIEDHVVRQAADLGQVLGLVGSAVGGNLASIMLRRQPRFPQARGADPVKVLANDRRHAPHRKGLHRRQHLDSRPVADIGEDRQVLPQPRGIDDESGAIDAGKIEVGESARIAGSGFHKDFNLSRSSPFLRNAQMGRWQSLSD